MQAKRTMVAAAAVCALLALPRVALAHAILVSSTPAANATVQGPDVTIELKYNSRLDAKRSTIRLAMPDGTVKVLEADGQSTSTSLHTQATLKPGHYTIRWQALSTDGHITRGEIPFTVK